MSEADEAARRAVYGPTGIVASLADAQQRENRWCSERLQHLEHALNGRRQYRRGKGRCKVCGGFLKGDR